jgi:hypothetical protein
MVKDTIEFRMSPSGAGQKLHDVEGSVRFVHDGHAMQSVVAIAIRLVKTGVSDDEAVERAFAMTDKIMQGMLDRGWAVMAPTFAERGDDRRVGFLDAAG